VTPEERFERLEQTLAEVAELQKAMQLDLAESRALGHKTDGRLDRATRLAVREARAQRRRIAEIDERLTQLSTAQLVTEEKLQGLIDSLRRGGNGAGKG